MFLVLVIVIGLFGAAFWYYNQQSSRFLSPAGSVFPSSSSIQPESNTLSTSPEPIKEEQKTFVHPKLKYSLLYPSSWTGELQEIPPGSKLIYQEFLAFSPDFQMSQEGMPVLEKGTSILVQASTPIAQTAEEQFNKNTMLKSMAKNVKNSSVAGNPAIQYDYSFEGIVATDTVFISNNIYYLIRLRYPSEKNKETYLPIYSSLLESFTLPE